MGITLKDIYEQRDMLRRGEEIARAAKQAEERERLRDTFAAAAFAGLLAQGDDGSFSEESYAVAAYRWADAMLRVRDSRAADTTNHDAAPAATATTKPGGLNSGSASGTSGEQSPVTTRDCGTGDTRLPKEKLAEVSDRTDPVPYSQTYENLGFAPTKRDATQPRNGTPAEGRVPDSRIANEPVAWATFYPNGSTASVYVGRQPPHAEPLYRHPQATLADAERESLRIVSSVFPSEKCAATLRGLLERLGGVR